MRKPIVLIVACLASLGGCVAASHLRQLQLPKAAKSPPVHAPVAAMQLGIDVDWYAYPGQDVKIQAAQTVAYVESLHANALSIGFPFFMDGTAPGSVHATTATPTPAEMNVVIADAQKAGLAVTLRPLLDDASLGRFRGGWRPSNLGAFFAAYRQFLVPYLQLAQRDGVAEFVEATELSAFDTSRAWDGFTRWVRTIYTGKVACAANWSSIPRRICGGAIETVDAYHEILGNEMRGWNRWDAKLAPGSTLSEVGIAAAPRAPSKPYVVTWPVSRVDPQVQARWFAAACHAAVARHLGGIYFWSIGLGKPTPGPTLSDQGSWADSAGQVAISRCFASITGGSL